MYKSDVIFLTLLLTPLSESLEAESDSIDESQESVLAS